MPEQATKKLNKQLGDLLRVHRVTISQPRQQMLQLDDVPVGAVFNQPMTNLLLRYAGDGWQVFVDADLQYQGRDDRRKRVFDGAKFRGWMRLNDNLAADGDVNDTIVWALNQLESDMRSVAPEELKAQFDSADRAHDREGAHAFTKHDASGLPDGLDDRVARLLTADELTGGAIEPTAAQSDAVVLAAESVLRCVAPNSPLLIGPSGVGKTAVARLAAGMLLDRGLVSGVIEVRGAAVCAGPIFVPERDERIRATLDAFADLGDSVVIFEQLDLVLSRSPVAISILADSLDQGTRIIGVARGDFRIERIKRFAQLKRRLEPCVLQPPQGSELVEILHRRWANHPLQGRVELSPDVLRLVAVHCHSRPGSIPASAIGLLEAVLNRADFLGRQCVGPDDVFHLVRQVESS